MSWFLWCTCQIYFHKGLVIGLNNKFQKEHGRVSDKSDDIRNVSVKILEKTINRFLENNLFSLLVT